MYAAGARNALPVTRSHPISLLERTMGVLDLLNQYQGLAPGTAPPEAETHFEQIAREAPQEDVAQGIAQAFRAEQTPPFESMVGQLFGRSNPEQRAGAP